MDNRAPCILSSKKDTCSIYQCIYKSISQSKDKSKSPSFIWFLTFSENTKLDGNIVDRGFMKMWPDIEGLVGIHGLNNEMRLYRDYIHDIVRSGECPHFVKYLTSGANCTLSQIAKIVNFSLSDFRSEYDKIDGNKQTWTDKITYSFCLIEKIDDSSMYLCDWIDKHIFDASDNWSRNMWIVIFQLSQACWALDNKQVTQGDMHFWNTRVLTITQESRTYQHPKKISLLNICHEIKIYDFDRGRSGQDHVKSLDMYFILKELYIKYAKTDLQKRILLDTFAGSAQKCLDMQHELLAAKSSKNVIIRFRRALRPFHDILSICAEKVNSMPSEPAMAAKKVVDVIPDVIDLISPDPESESSSEIERQLFCKRRKVFPAVSLA